MTDARLEAAPRCSRSVLRASLAAASLAAASFRSHRSRNSDKIVCSHLNVSAPNTDGITENEWAILKI